MVNKSRKKRKVGRPPAKLTELMKRVRCTPTEREAWERAASEDGRTFAGWVRHLLNKNTRKS